MNAHYIEAVKAIKSAILHSQGRAAKSANAEMLALYYAIGGYVSRNSREGTWGNGAIDEISARLREELPGLRGFSAENIKLMRRFHEEWESLIDNTEATLSISNSVDASTELEKQLQQAQKASDFPSDAFISIGFSHHIEILRNSTTLDERLFYITACSCEH